MPGGNSNLRHLWTDIWEWAKVFYWQWLSSATLRSLSWSKLPLFHHLPCFRPVLLHFADLLDTFWVSWVNTEKTEFAWAGTEFPPKQWIWQRVISPSWLSSLPVWIQNYSCMKFQEKQKWSVLDVIFSLEFFTLQNAVWKGCLQLWTLDYTWKKKQNWCKEGLKQVITSWCFWAERAFETWRWI